MKILAIDTATQVCSAAIIVDAQIAGECLISGRHKHSEKLLALIDVLFNHAQISPHSLDLIAVSVGPGSFTGLRAGISTAQGLAFSLGKEMVAVPTLEIIAAQAVMYHGFICPMIDARKQQVYTCLYRCSETAELEKVSADIVVDPETWIAGLPGRTLFAGSGALLYQDTIQAVLKGAADFLPEYLGIPRSSTLACVAQKSYELHGPSELSRIAPLYIRLPDAAVHSA
ncbi:MAG: tRNA (adenosine(37)-N6)-threonylcarbamoyltransferase complex dimerization subunit type 1 TsaB [Pseudomonadota bacterium]